MLKHSFFTIATLIVTPALHAQTPFIQSANNTASYDSTAIAQGSMFVIFGSSLGPAALVSATTLPLPNNLSGTSVTVKSGSTTLPCPMFYTSAGQVVAVLPSNTPLGIATVSITYNGKVSGTNSATINVVASSIGMFTPDASGIGIGIFTDALTGAHITPSNPATPGEILTGWATGVGADGSDNTVAPVLNFPGVQVWVGGQAATMEYAGPGGGVALDQLNFYVPKTTPTFGCNVPVIVTSNGISSNTTTIPIGATAGVPCSDSGPTFPSGLLTDGAAGKPVRLGAITITPISSANPASRQPQSVADQLSAALHVRVSVEDADRIMRAVESHNAKALKSAMSRYAAQWKALSARAKAQVADSVSAGQAVMGLALFGTVTNESVATSALGQDLPPSGSCAVAPFTTIGTLGATAAGLDAGASVSILGAAGSFTLPEKNIGTYQGAQGNTVTADIPVGTYTISAPGGKDIAAFSSTITIPSHPTLSNTASLATINRSQPVTVTWTGGISGKSVLIGGSSPGRDSGLPSQISAADRAFACIADGGAGTFTIPSYILSAMWPTPDSSGRIYITADPRSEEVTIPGLDAVWILDFSVGKAAVIFK